jgi:hypothetical protein
MMIKMSARIAIVRVFTEPPEERGYHPRGGTNHTATPLLRAVTFRHLVDASGELDVGLGDPAGRMGG